VFQRRDGVLAVESIHPDVTPEELRAATGFAIEVDGRTPVTPAPTDRELAVLAEVDPDGVSGSEF
jgi:glutaconate CoA-transferase subunit B